METWEIIRKVLLGQFVIYELTITMVVDDFESVGRELFDRTKDKLNSATNEYEFDRAALEIIKEGGDFIFSLDSERDLDSLNDEETVKFMFYNGIIANINSLYVRAKEGNLDIN